MTETTPRPRIRVPARSGLLASTALATIQFRGIGAGAEKPKSEDDDMTEEQKKAQAPKDKADNEAAAAPAPTDDDDDDDDDDDEDEDREEMATDTPVRAARLRERSRIAAILEAPAAAANLEFAVRLALSTNLPRGEAIGLLQAAPKPAAAGRLKDRMADYGNIRPGAGGQAEPKGQAAIDALWAKQGEAAGFVPARR